MSIAIQSTPNFKGDRISVNMFTGAADAFVNNSVRVLDASIASTSKQLNSPTAGFTRANIGNVVYVEGAGSGGSGLVAIITSWISGTRVLVSIAAGTTVTAVEAYFGPDATSMFQSANDAIAITKLNGGCVKVPKGMYLTTDTINVSSHVRFEGEAYVNTSVYGDTNAEPPSFVRCVNPVPVFSTDGAPCYSPAFVNLGISGVPYSGSKGIYGLTVWNCQIEGNFFENFGDQAIHLEKFDAAATFSVTSRVVNNFAQNCVRVRTQADFIGVFDIGTTDAFVYDNNCNASMDGEGIINNTIAALAIRGTNSLVGANQCGHSELGVFVDEDCAQSVFIGTRADNNQGQGWIIYGSENGFIGCRSFANSQASDGGYNAYSIFGAGNSFTACRNGYNGEDPTHLDPLFFHVNDVFCTLNDNGTDSNYFQFNNVQPGSYLGEKYRISGTQVIQPIADFTSHFDGIPGRGLVRVLNDIAMLERPDGSASIFWIRDSGAGANAKLWGIQVNNPTNLNQLVFTAWNDAFNADSVWCAVTRSGYTISEVALSGAQILLTGDVKIPTATASRPAKFDSNHVLFGDKIDLTSEVVGILPVANGGTGASSVPYYTKSEVDTMIAGLVASITALQTDVLNLQNDKADHGNYPVVAGAVTI